MTNSEKIEAQSTAKNMVLKSWKWLVALIVIVALSFFGYRYWQNSKIEKLTIASDKYEQLSSQVKIKDLESANDLAQFAFENDNIYGVLAGLKATKFYVDYKKDYEGAEKLLLDAKTKSSTDSIQAIINLRLARIQFQLQKYDDSLKTLNDIKSKHWLVSANNVKGDVLVKMKKYDEAIAAYNVALASDPIPDLVKDIKMKLNQTEYLKSAN